MPLFGPRQHFHWNFMSYESKDPLPGGVNYIGGVVIDIVTRTRDPGAARSKAQAVRPMEGSLAGYELRAVTEHVAGTCWPK